MAEVRTDVVIAARTRGFAQVQQEAANLNQSAAKALEQQTRGFADAEKAATELGRKGRKAAESLSVKDALQQVEQLTERFAELGDISTEDARREVERLTERFAELGGISTEEARREVERLAESFAELGDVGTDQARQEVERLAESFTELGDVSTEDARKEIERLAQQFGALRDVDTESAREDVERLRDGLDELGATDTRKLRKQVSDLVADLEGLGELDSEGLQEATADLEKRLKELAKQQLATTRVLSEMEDKASPGYKALAADLKSINRELGDVERTIRTVERAFKDQGKAAREATKPVTPQALARGGFTQGLVQGAVPGAGPFIQRGPGMRRQIGGMAVGGMLRGVAGGAAAMPFSGAAGLARMVSSIPFVGGLLAAPLQQSMQRAGVAMQMQQATLQTMPQLGGAPLLQRMRGAQRRARRQFPAELARQVEEARLDAALGEIDPDDIEQVIDVQRGKFVDERMEEARRRGLKRGRLGATAAEVGFRKVFEAEFEAEMGGRETLEAKAEVVARQVAGAMAEHEITGESPAARRRRRQRFMQKQAARERRRFYAPIRGAGVELLAGGAPEAMQAAAQIQQVGGGGAGALRRQGLLKAAFAAQSMFGAGPGVTGAFLQAGRQGGLVGAQPGRMGEELSDTISDAMTMGLEGSEINDYLQQIATGIQSWKQTGIPINRRSIGEMSSSFGQMGLGGVRGRVVAGGIAGAAQQIGLPQTASQLVMLQTLGGFRGGGPKQLFEARKRLQEGLQMEDVEKMMDVFLGPGRGDQERYMGMLRLESALKGMGVQMGVSEIEMLEKQRRGIAFSPAEQERMTQIETQMERGRAAAPATAEQLIADTAEMVSKMAPNVKRQAALVNQQIDTGMNMINAMQNLEKTASTIAQKFAKEFGPMLGRMTKAMERFTEVLLREGEEGGFLEAIKGALE